jgi:SAM-dependent methyltransferase
MTQTQRHADYDQISQTFDRRYERNPYAGVERALRQFIGSQPGLHVLEAGCGTGHWLEKLRGPGVHLTGLDYSAGMLAHARKRLPGTRLIRARAEKLPLPDQAFDRVFCVNAIHHFTDKSAFLADVRRVLQPGGRLWSVGLDPHSGRDQWFVYEYFPESLAIDRQRYLSSEALREQMTGAGFRDCVTEEVEQWSIRLPARELIEQGRLDKASTSQLSVLTDAEYRQGAQRIQDDMLRMEQGGQTLFLTVALCLYGTSGSV